MGDYNSLTLEVGLVEDLPHDKKQSEMFSFMFEKTEKILFQEFAKRGVSYE